MAAPYHKPLEPVLPRGGKPRNRGCPDALVSVSLTDPGRSSAYVTTMKRAMFVTGGVLVVVMVVGAVLLLIRGDPYAGGLIWNDFTKSYAGGEGSLPAGVENKDFLRCKACHGWDAMGANGGYVRRTGFPEKDSRPWPISGTDLIAIGGRFSLAEVTHDGGRLFTTENNEGPDFMQEGALTSRQARDVRAFVNRGPKVGDVATLDITQNPVRYRFTDADAGRGAELYTQNCAECHGSDGKEEDIGRDDGLIEYFRSDGKYSEGFHKTIYGADQEMSRERQGNLDSADARDILAWIQQQADDSSRTGLGD